MKKIGSGLRKLELFELVEIAVAILCLIFLLVKGQALDSQAGVAGWIWRPLQAVGATYLVGLPLGCVLLLGCLLFYGWRRGWRRQRNLRWGLWQTWTAIRYIWPFCMVMIVYSAVNFYIPILSPVDRDDWLLAADHWIFGTEPSLWLQTFISPHLTDLFSCFYMAWFPSLFATLFFLLWKSREAATGYLLSVLAAFYIAYYGYTLVPAVGPLYSLAHRYTVGLGGGGLTHWQEQVVSGHDLVIPHDCFPSLHTGIACVMVYYIWRYWRRLLWVYGPLAGGIMAATIYLRYHYVTDLIAGVVLAAVTCICGDKCNRLWRMWRNNRERAQKIALQQAETQSGMHTM